MATFNAYPATQVQLPNFAQALAQAQQIKGMQQQQKMAELQMDAYQREQERAAKTRQLQGKAIAGDQQAMSALEQYDLSAANTVGEYVANKGEREAKMGLRKMEGAWRMLQQAGGPEDVMRALSGVIPPERMDGALAEWQRDPEGFARSLRDRAMSLSEQVLQGNWQQTYDAGQQDARISQANQAAQLDIARQNAATSRMSATPTEVREYEYAARQAKAAGQPVPDFTTWAQGMKASGAARTFNQIGANEGEFAKKAAGKAAEMMEALGTAGESARTNLARIDRLESLLSNSGGVGNNLLAIAGRLGIPLDGASEAAAAQAIIASMVPAQRVPGSGTTSDFDAKKFEQALPSLSGTPEGNSYIIGTMRALAEDAAKRGDIANRALFGEISAGEAREALKAMPGPKFPPLPSSIVTEPAMGVRQGNPGAALQFMQGRKQSGDAPASALSPEQQEIFKRLMQ